MVEEIGPVSYVLAAKEKKIFSFLQAVGTYTRQDGVASREEQKNPWNTSERLISLGKNKTKEEHLITFKYFLANAWGNSSIPPSQRKAFVHGKKVIRAGGAWEDGGAGGLAGGGCLNGRKHRCNS